MPFTEYGLSVESGEFSGLPTEEAQKHMIAAARSSAASAKAPCSTG